MKKIFSFVAAALMSVAMFAEPAKVPTVGEIEANFDATNNVVIAVYFDAEICNDVVLIGNHNGWNKDDVANLTPSQELDGYDGWFIFEAPAIIEGVDDDGNPTSSALQAKPGQLDSEGKFSWDYQTGDPASWIHLGGLEAEITAGFDGEANITWPSAGVYVYESQYFKNHNNPCEAGVFHDYKVTLYAPACGGYVPGIRGDFNDWGNSDMVEDLDDEGEKIYTAEFNDKEGHAFKFSEAGKDDWDNQIILYNAENDEWYQMGNYTLGEEENIVLHYESGRWTLCEEEALEIVVAEAVATKTIRNGQIVIVKGNAEFTVLGTQVK